MKVYLHPVSTTSRPILLFAAESGADIEFQVVDLFTGEHLQDAFAAINPNRMVPVLEDGDFRLTESSAILKYIADKIGSPAYPKDLRKRAKVNEMMDWLNTNLYRDFAYGFVYPQIFPHHRRPTEALQAGTLAWGKERARGWLKILDENLIGRDKRYLCGNEISLADFLGAPMLTVGEVAHCDFSPWSNVARWIATMKALPSWGKVNEVFNGLVRSTKDATFEPL